MARPGGMAWSRRPRGPGGVSGRGWAGARGTCGNPVRRIETGTGNAAGLAHPCTTTAMRMRGRRSLEETQLGMPKLVAGLFGAAFLFSFLLTPVTRLLAQRWGWLDPPDSVRKVHGTPMPRIGGIAILLGWLLPLLGLQALGGLEPSSTSLIWRLLPAVLAIFATGLLDDAIGLNAKQKLAGQAVAALLACWAGLYFRTLAGFELHPAVGVALTLIWLIACSNCYNLIDGVDGLAAGTGLIAALAIVAVSLMEGHVLPLLLAIPLAGSLLGFLPFNFNPASIFLGDSGSLLTGFVLGCCLVQWPHRNGTLLDAVAPCIILAIPFLDAGISVIRRWLDEKPICLGDQGHLHHRLLGAGLGPRGVAIAFYVGGLLAAAVAVVRISGGSAATVAATAVFGLVIAAAAAHLYRRELLVLMELPRNMSLRRRARTRVALRGYEARLRRAGTPEECWRTLGDAAREFGFTMSALRIGDRHFEDGLPAAERISWTLRVALPRSGFVTVECPIGIALSVETVCDALVRGLTLKAGEFLPARVAPLSGSRGDGRSFAAGVAESKPVTVR